MADKKAKVAPKGPSAKDLVAELEVLYLRPGQETAGRGLFYKIQEIAPLLPGSVDKNIPDVARIKEIF